METRPGGGEAGTEANPEVAGMNRAISPTMVMISTPMHSGVPRLPRG